MTVTAVTSPTGHPGYTQNMPRRPESVGAARELVRVVLVGWGLDDLVEPGALLVSELVTNSVRHTRCRAVRVTVARLAQNTVCIAVVDKSRSRPVVRAPGNGEISGRGLVIVEALTDRWGTDSLLWGKRVWGELTCKDTQ